MIIKLYEDNPNPREILEIVKILKDGGIIVYPTDTLYAFGCDITNAKAVEKICAIKNIDPVKIPLSFVCSNISHVSNYSFIDNKLFKILKSCLPGPFTFLLKGNSNLPKLFKKKNVVGIRIPDNKIALAIVEALGNPILSSSVPINEEEIEYSTDPELIEEFFGNRVDCVIAGGIGETEPSTIIDCTGDDMEVKRKGKGIFIPE
jgi:tRNA threonylcarbamoyl adenosine modification protein (Sua5/YciO/YrdC/YwlC family)